MRVVFMGTPDFAVASLEQIVNSKHEVVAVVTVPDKPAGRGLKLQFSEVKRYALENNIAILQPEKLKDQTFIETLNKLQADAFVVVAFRMLPEMVYSIPPKGTFNVHASLLPNYRGAAPIHWAIMNGETKTGVTTFFLNSKIDCGDIILQKEIEILPNENTGDLYNKLKDLGANLAVETLNLMESNKVSTYSQNDEIHDIKTAPKITKQDTIIDWSCAAKEIVDKIRGLAPFPGAITSLEKKTGEIVTIKIFEACVTKQITNSKVGEIVTDNQKFLNIMASDLQISILNLQLEGKNRMNIRDFLRGLNVNNYAKYAK